MIFCSAIRHNLSMTNFAYTSLVNILPPPNAPHFMVVCAHLQYMEPPARETYRDYTWLTQFVRDVFFVN